MSGTRVLVAGASIAGPALAHWLRRRGAEVTVVERAPELRPGGQAVDARGVAKEVIGRMGLDAAVRAACTDTAGAHTVDADGQVLETFRADDDGGDGFIADIEILRGDLSRVLYNDTRDGVEYIFGDRIAELTQDADGVDVAFAGGDRRRFDLVVGADGLHSALRAMVFGPHERFLRHLGHVLAFYSVPNEFGLDRWLLEYQDQQFRIQPEQTPITPGEVGFEVAMRPDRHPHDVLPAIQFLAGLAESDGLRLDIPGAPAAPIRPPQATAPTILAPIRTFLAQLEALQRVQDATGTTFGVPTLTRVDQDMLYFADQLLTHGHVEWYWPGMSVRLPLDQVERVLSSGPLIPRMNLDGSGGGPIVIAGHTLTMPGTITLQVSNAVVVNPAELHRIINQPTPAPNALVHIGVQADTQVIFRLQAETNDSDEDPAHISEVSTS